MGKDSVEDHSGHPSGVSDMNDSGMSYMPSALIVFVTSRNFFPRGYK